MEKSVPNHLNRILAFESLRWCMHARFWFRCPRLPQLPLRMKLGWQCTYMCIVCSGEEAEQVACRHLDKFRCCWSCFSKLDVQLSEDVSWSMKRLSTCLEIASLALASTLFSALCPKAIPELHKSYSLTQGYKDSFALGCVKRESRQERVNSRFRAQYDRPWLFALPHVGWHSHKGSWMNQRWCKLS